MSARSMRRARQRATEREQRRERQRHLRLARRASIAGAAVGTTVLFAPAAEAATFQVNSQADPGDGTCNVSQCTLREAVGAAESTPGADTISFAPGLTGTITLTSGDLAITDPVSISGPGAGQLTISGDADADGEFDFKNSTSAGDSRIFDLAGSYGGPLEAVSISGLTLSGGVASDYYTYDGYSDYSAENGGAIRSFGRIDLSLSDCVLTGNLATNSGGALSTADETDLTIDDSEIADNRAYDDGGGVSAEFDYGYGVDSQLTLTDSTVEDNYAGGYSPLFGSGYSVGGGLQINGPFTIDNATVSGNTAHSADDGYEYGYGGGIASYGEYEGASTISHSTISANDSGGFGGGAALLSDTAIDDTTVSGNTSDSAGGLQIRGGSITDSTISNNDATDRGGGVVLQRGSIARSTISGNEASSAGGIELESGAVLRASAVTGNTAQTGGGVGIFYSYRNPRIVNSTISGNDAVAGTYGSGVGGGLAVEGSYSEGDDGLVVVRNSTIAANTAADAGGGIYSDVNAYVGGSYEYAAAGELDSAIVADNTANGLASDVDGEGTPVVPFIAGFSLIEKAAPGTISADPAGSNIRNTDPQLGPLADNGGPTETHQPSDTSPALDAGQGNGLATDQRGLARTVDTAVPNASLSDGTDIGAVELQSVTLPTPGVSNTGGPPGSFASEPTISSSDVNSKRRKATFRFSANQPNARFECSLDGGPFKACGSRHTFRQLKPGNHVLQVRTRQQPGGAGQAPVATKRFEIKQPG